MKKIIFILALLLILISCTKEQPLKVEIQETIPVEETITIETVPEKPLLNHNIQKYIFQETEKTKLTSADATYDKFGEIEVERYDARYQSDITTLARIFKFKTKQEMEKVLNNDFHEIIEKGFTQRLKHNIAIFLSEENNRIAVWTNEDKIIYIETRIPDFVEREILDLYLEKYPSDLKTKKCIDSDSSDHLRKGTTTRVKLTETEMEWEDVCLKDFAPYKNQQYYPIKSQSKDLLLEGRCWNDITQPGYIEEYVCPGRCEDGKCVN